MASARKRYNPHKSTDSEKVQYRTFLEDLLLGTIKAEKLIESRNGQGKLILDYDDPNG